MLCEKFVMGNLWCYENSGIAHCPGLEDQGRQPMGSYV